MTLYSRAYSTEENLESDPTNTCDRVKMHLNALEDREGKFLPFLSQMNAPVDRLQNQPLLSLTTGHHWANTATNPEGFTRGSCVWAAHPANAGLRALAGMVRKVVFIPNTNPCSPCQTDVLGMGMGPAGSCPGTGSLHCMAGPGALIPDRAWGDGTPQCLEPSGLHCRTWSQPVKLSD